MRAAGKLRMEGRSYEVQDGDIIHVSRGSACRRVAVMRPPLLLFRGSFCMQFKFGQAAK